MGNKLILFVLAFVISASFASANWLEASDFFITDGSTNGDPWHDAKTFVNKQLIMEIQASNIIVACWDFSNTNCDENPTYDTCYAASQSDLTKCAAYDSWINTKPKVINAAPGVMFMPVSAAIKTCADAKYYKNCNGVGGGSSYSVAQEQYFVFSQRKFDCDDGNPFWSTYDAEGWTGAEYDYNDGIACPAGTLCSENADDTWYKSAVETMANPCRKADWASCTLDSQCASGKCNDGECNSCNTQSCVINSLNYCALRGSLYSNKQYYCPYASTNLIATCTTASHTSCQQKDSYYCTNDGGSWAWKVCQQGCSGGACITTISAICIDESVRKVKI